MQSYRISQEIFGFVAQRLCTQCALPKCSSLPPQDFFKAYAIVYYKGEVILSHHYWKLQPTAELTQFSFLFIRSLETPDVSSLLFLTCFGLLI